MKILWFTWKDQKHPRAGGAELVNEEIAKRLVKDGHEVVFLTAGFKNCVPEEIVNGYKIIRLGNRWTVYLKAFWYYLKFLKGWADLVIDEVNTGPFFCKFFVKEENCLFIHQLARQIWFYEMFFPLNIIGYFVEPLYLRLLNDRKVITVSESTKKDLLKRGFKNENIEIISEGINIVPLTESELNKIEKYEQPTIATVGELRPVKRTDHIVRAFELAKKEIPDLQLIIAGEKFNGFGRKIEEMAAASEYSDSIKLLGRVENGKRAELLGRAHVFCAASVKEGWGLVITEANSQGTPAVAYDIDGYRDSVRNTETGLLCAKNTPEEMAKNIIAMFKNKEVYERMRRNAWKWSREINFENCYKDFFEIIAKI